MRVFCEIEGLRAHALMRIREQIMGTAPEDIIFVPEIGLAEIQILLVIGIKDTVERLARKPGVMIQLCYKTAASSLEVWPGIWNKALMVSSYYDLPLDGKFVLHPIGFDPEVFRSRNSKRDFDALVTGYVDGPPDEEISSVYQAFRGKIVHVGKDFKLGDRYNHLEGITDLALASFYNRAKYTFGLRHIEGFELPVIEGAACGCQPVVFDLPCYRRWYDDFAIFIDPKKDVTTQLMRLEYDKPLEHDLSRFHIENAWRPFWDKFQTI